jgi:uncharacterized membrane protein
MEIFTTIHVIISLIAIFAGLVALAGMLNNSDLHRWTAIFLAFTVATSVTGFLFPFHGFTPAIGVGIISMILLAIAIFARYSRHTVGHWRWLYVVTAIMSLYLNCFVLVVQSFQKIPALKALAPTQSEPPFAVAQLTVLVLFIVLTIISLIRFRPKRT